MMKGYEGLLNKFRSLKVDIDGMPDYLQEGFKDRYTWYALGMLAASLNDGSITHKEYQELDKIRKEFFA